MNIFLQEVSGRFPEDFILMIMDKAAWHTTHGLQIPANIRLVFLPPCSPRLNPLGHPWKEIREKYFGNKVFENIDAAKDQLMAALVEMNNSPTYVKSFAGFKWIIDALLYI